MARIIQLAFVLGVFVRALTLVSAKRNMRVHMDAISVQSDKDFLNIEGKLRTNAEGVKVVDVSVDLHHNVEAEVFIENEIFIKTDGVYTSFMKGAPLNICMFFANPQLNPFLAIIMKTMNKFGNQMTSCPIDKLKYDVVGFHLDNESLPAFIPAGDYRIEVKTSRLPKAGGPMKMLMQFDCDSRVEFLD